jgi:UDP-3-O-[3-hydroxymyristoyl] glucosamine N-acyltransferase
MNMTLNDVASLVGGELRGDAQHVVTGLKSIDQAGPSDATFLTNERYARHLGASQAGCILVTRGVVSDEELTGHNSIIVDDAYRGFVLLMQQFFPSQLLPEGYRATTAFIDEEAEVHASASIGPGCVVSKGCSVGPGSQLFANVTLYPGTVIGERCLIHAGAVIGADGFGFLENADGSFVKIPQVGTVRIGNDVEIGANCTIDRAAVGETVIEDGVKIDNLVHIAHGARIGKDSAIAAQAGISGSTKLGQRNRIAGQVGIVGHITIADDVIVEAQSGISKTIKSAGAYFGSPAKDHRTALRIEAALRRLPELLREVADLQKRVDELSKKDQ